ncbi:barstar family protein [Patiriisocius sp. Uisw_017]|uniref:barstar family protein n=1 Tax=Patiriisocius sp. Uisw_017 TaxID=3230968 RepID=UPI0039EBE7D0
MAFRIEKLKTKYKNSALCLSERLSLIFSATFHIRAVGSNLRTEMQTFRIKGKRLKNWKTFHSEFKKEMNFPDYYGENMNAWIDCVDELTDEPTILQIDNGKYLKENEPELFNAILECGAFVNYRKIKVGEKPNLIIATDN